MSLYQDILFIGTEEGNIIKYDTSNNISQIYQNDSKRVKCLKIVEGFLVSGSSDGR